MIEDAVGEVVADVAGAVVRHTGGLVVDLTVQHIFSPHTARFFHGVGRRVIAAATFGAKRIPTSLRMAPVSSRPKPRRADWIALWTGVSVWIALFLGIGFAGPHFL